MAESTPGDFHVYEPRLGHGLPHDPFNAIVGPRPIGWISSRDRQGRLNRRFRVPVLGRSRSAIVEPLAASGAITQPWDSK